LTLTGKTPGSGKFTLKFDYSANGKSQQFSAKIPVVVKNTHINQDQTATNLFKKNMVLEEKSGDYVFVKPDANPQYEAVVYNWGKANGSFDDELHNLATDVADEFKPEVVGFVETVKDLNEAETPKAITETLLRSLAPSIIFGVSDFIELGKAATKLQAEEKSFLKLFNAKEFINIPVYNENGEKVGLAKSIIKKSGGKTYAVKIGVINLISFSDF
jgi:hypothetical protein